MWCVLKTTVNVRIDIHIRSWRELEWANLVKIQNKGIIGDALVLRTKFTVFVHSGSRYDAYVDVDSDIDNGLQNLQNAPHISLTADDLTSRKSRGASKNANALDRMRVKQLTV